MGKVCTKCGEEKPLSAYYRDKGKSVAACKDCKRAQIYERREREPWHHEASRAKYLAKNRERIREKAREYRAENREQVNARDRERRRRNPAHYKAVQARARAKPERRERARQAMREWYRENKERHRENGLRWARTHPEYYLNRNHIRRTLEREGDDINRWAVLERDKAVCGWCGEVIFEKFDLDHIVPVTKGGAHRWENVRALHPSCNREKADRLVVSRADLS